MAGEKADNAWPLPAFYFAVDITGVGDNLIFQEVSGLDIQAQPIEYRAGDNNVFSTIKMPGLAKAGNVTLKKGVFARDTTFFEWHRQIGLDTIKRATVTIRLMDQGGSPTMVWTLSNAWPSKITGTDLEAGGNDVAVESIEIAYEGLTIENR